jgi:spermidine synthase
MNTFLKHHSIPFLVFTTGACVLVIEITATRILAPYFGNTIFAVSSVISVVLLALSMGYYVGGRMADRYPTEKVFFSIIVLSGFFVVFLHILGIVFLSSLGYSLPLVQGPIIASVMLFFAQNFLLGMLSPFAIKIQSMRQEAVGIGRVSGQIFFWSTLGSIFGSLAAGFFLIPHFGINTIMLSIGVLLITIGLSCLAKVSLWLRIWLAVVLCIVGMIFIQLCSFVIHSSSLASLVYIRDGLYQRVTIFEGLHQNMPARFLMLDRDSSAATFINSDDLAYEYTKYYALYHIFNPNIKEALMIGGGGYSVPKALLQDLPQVAIDVAEIEPSLFSLGQQYFNVQSDPRLHNVVEDGRRLLHDSPKYYDMIFSDAYASMYSTPSHLATQEFFKLAKSKLTDNGMFMANVIGSLAPKKDSLALSEIATFKSVFPNSYFFAVNDPGYLGLQNIIFVGYNSAKTVDFGVEGIKSDRNPIISRLAEKQINLGTLDLSLYPILTDDYVPIDYLISKEL